MGNNNELLRGYKDFIAKNALAILFLFIALLGTVIFFFVANPSLTAKIAGDFGLLGVFAGAVVANATIVIPIPFDVILLPIFANPLLIGIKRSLAAMVAIGLAAGIGAAIGECSSYVFGYLGINSIRNPSREETKKLNDFRLNLQKSGPIIIFTASFLPFPFDFVGVAAGVIKYNFFLFFISALAGKTLRHVLLGIAIFYGLEFLAAFLA